MKTLLLLSLTILMCTAADAPQAVTTLLNENTEAADTHFFVNAGCAEILCTHAVGCVNLKLYDNVAKGTNRNDDCMDLIGIKPLSKTRLQVFVAVKKLPSSESATIILTFKSGTIEEKVLECDIKNGKTTPNNPATAGAIVKKVTLAEKNRRFDSTIDNQMTECASVIIECEDYTKLDQQTWKLTVKGDTKIEGTSSATFEKKMRCDAMNLISRNPSADNEKKVVLTNTPSIDFAYLNAVKECAADELMTYTENGDMSEKHAESIACKKNGDAYQYAVKAYDKGGNGQTTYIPAEHNISVICIAPKCRMCTPLQPFPDAECPKGSDCKKKKVAEEPHPPSLEECFTLNIECDKLMILNGKIEKASPKKVKCDGTGKYMHENIVINKLSCLEQYSPYDKTFPKTSLKSIQKQYEVLTTEPEGCEEFGDCFCKDPKQKLAFANSQGTEWRRVENITFDSDNNKWMYERKVNNADEKAELNANRSVMCVAALMTPAALPNKKSGLVYATSLGILFLVAIISIVAVILLVNARIKKRELHKAKKEEDKKKKKGDADKKDDDKKDNEQKNEA